MQAPIKTDDEFNKLFAFAAQMRRSEQYRLMLLLSIKLGMRPKEIAGMQSTWMRGEELRIPQGHSKGKGGRTLPTNSEIREAYETLMQGRKGTVFLNEAGQGFTARGISDAFCRLYREADVAGSCYSGRRTLATNLVDRNVALTVVQKVLGHAHLSTTAIYCATTPRMIERALFA